MALGDYIEFVKQSAAGHWPEILRSLAPELAPALDAGPNKHVCCPLPGHDDRNPSFRIDKPDEGRAVCSCGAYDAWNLLELLRGWTFPKCAEHVGEYLGLRGGGRTQAHQGKASGNGKRANAATVDPVARMAAVKHCPAESLRAYGATTIPNSIAVKIPMFGADGKHCSTFTVNVDSSSAKYRKGMNEEGKDAGLFFPVVDGEPRVPKAGETWLYVEGVKDCAASHGLGFQNTCGPSGKYLKPEWLPLFRGVHLVLCLNNDAAGIEAAQKIEKGTQKKGLASVRVVKLPAAGDVRDNIAAVGADAVRQAIDPAHDVAQEGETDPDPWPAREYTAADLATLDFSITWLCDEVLVAMQPGTAGGGWKCLKTSVLLDLFVSLASGTDFLKRFHVPHRVRVGYISSESGMNTNQETFVRICRSKGIEDPGSLADQFVITDDSHDFTTSAGIDALLGWAKRREFVAVGVDPAYLNFSGLAETSANVFAVGAALRRFSCALLSEGITPVVAHHSVKVPLDRYAPLDLAALSGSGWAEFARQWILLSRRAEYEDGSGFHQLHCRIGGSAGHSSLWHLDVDEGPADQIGQRKWRVGLTEAGQAKRDAARAKDEMFERDVQDKAALIVRYLEQRPNMADTQTAILKGNIGRSKSAFRALEVLAENGRIVFETDCVRKSGHKTGGEGYRLLQGQPEEGTCPS